MAMITHGKTERYRIGGNIISPLTEDAQLSVPEAILCLHQGYQISLYVDGWSDPWDCDIDGEGYLRGRCPTSEVVWPRIAEEVEGKLARAQNPGSGRTNYPTVATVCPDSPAWGFSPGKGR